MSQKRNRSSNRDGDVVPLAERIMLRPREAATAIGCSRSSIYALVKKGLLKGVWLGAQNSMLRIPISSLHELAARVEFSEGEQTER